MSKILSELLKDPEYKNSLDCTLKRYQLRKVDVNNCSRNIYHELSKHAHTRYYGNMTELVVHDKEHTITEVASIETIFSTLKKRRCFRLPLTIQVQ